MTTLTATRFNKKTWNERQQWMERNRFDLGCIYGTPVCVKEHIKGNIIVLEMHNDENKVKGIGLIKNALFIKEKDKNKLQKTSYRIYNDRNYNRYIYKSNYRIDSDSVNQEEKKIIEIFNVLLFKGPKHLKRGQGITLVPKWITNNRHINFIEFFRELFVKYHSIEEI